MREIEILAQSFLDEYLAGMQLKRTARTGFSPLQDALCTRDKVVDGGKSRPDPWQFYRFLNTAKNLELAIPASYQPVIRIKCGTPGSAWGKRPLLGKALTNRHECLPLVTHQMSFRFDLRFNDAFACSR